MVILLLMRYATEGIIPGLDAVSLYFVQLAVMILQQCSEVFFAKSIYVVNIYDKSTLKDAFL